MLSFYNSEVLEQMKIYNDDHKRITDNLKDGKDEEANEEYRQMMQKFNKSILPQFWKKADERIAGRDWSEIMEEERIDKEKKAELRALMNNFELVE